MIFFITGYDPATNANLFIITPLLSHGVEILVGPSATKANMQELLMNRAMPMFVMTHGESDSFYDNNDEKALCLSDINMLDGKRLFVYACYTANELGRKSTLVNSIYWGYTGPVAAPSDSDELAQLYRNIFQFIILNFANASNQEEIFNVIEQIKVLCEEAEHKLDELYLRGDEVSYAEYASIKNIWERLRVSIHGAGDEQICHPQATLGDLFELYKKRDTF